MSITLASLSENWLGLSRERRPSAFWFWNSGMDCARMAEVIDKMAENDIREFLIHPVHGLEVEYLSDEYFERCRYALGLARERGLKVWIYDEYGWPSGAAGGLLLRDHPEHKGWCLSFSRDESGKVVAEPKQSDRVLDNTTAAPWARGEAGYLDTLSDEAVRCFIRLTHERYYAECADFFDGTIAGFFTDEPVTMMDVKSDQPGGWGAAGLPWTPNFPARFKARFGCDIEPRYADLVGDGPSQIKRDYWALAKEMHSEAYHGQIGRWCREHGVKYTGHLGEDLLLMQVRFAGSAYECLKHMDEPGVDYLGHAPEPDDKFIEQALIRSIARHSGKTRVYCEAFGISPWDIRPGSMLRRAQMLGINGVDDIALMGLHQNLDGVRKRTYWPPIFDQAPWWEFYPEFRDAFARSVALASLGMPAARYAILYPQNQLEQTDVLNTDIWSGDDKASRVVNALGQAIFAAGETFDFVFPEILDQAAVESGDVVFPRARYDAILAPSDLAYFDESLSCLAQLKAAGGRILDSDLESITASIGSVSPSWSDVFDISGLPADGIRVYRFTYPDGELLALRNVTDRAQQVRVGPSASLAEWDPATGEITSLTAGRSRGIDPHATLYVTSTEAPLGKRQCPSGVLQPIHAEWLVSSDRPNMARLRNVRFQHGDRWIDALDSSPFGAKTGPTASGIPMELRGRTSINVQGEFTCESLPERLSLLFERDHLTSLAVNGVEIDLSKTHPLSIWDTSCAIVDITRAVSRGRNVFSGTLAYEEFETTIRDDAFFHNWCMPRCDVLVCGSFRLIDGAIHADDRSPLTFPADLSEAGWSEFDGIISLTARIDLDSSLAEAVTGIEVDLIAEDCVEVLLDGRSLGRRIARPYTFSLDHIDAGEHVITIRLSSTSGNALDEPSRWGVRSICWVPNPITQSPIPNTQ